DPPLTGALSGFHPSDGVMATYSREPGNTVAGYTISATLTPAAVLGNYLIKYNTATLTVNRAAASVTPNAASKTVGAADPPLTGTLTGFLASDNVTATYGCSGGGTLAGSPYTISATLSPTAVLGNYSITYNTANFTINPGSALIPLSVTTNNATKLQGQPNPAFTVSYTGFVDGDSPSSLGGTLSFTTNATTT